MGCPCRTSGLPWLTRSGARAVWQVRLVRKRDTTEIFALKSMIKEAMRNKNQVHLRPRIECSRSGDYWQFELCRTHAPAGGWWRGWDGR